MTTTHVAPEETALERLLSAMEDMRDGNFRRRVTVSGNGTVARLASVFNEINERNQALVGELMRVREAAKSATVDGERVRLDEARGGWKIAVDSANDIIDDLRRPTTELTRVLRAIADGNLSQRMPVCSATDSLDGEADPLSTMVNEMLDQVSLFASETTRVLREVGTQGRLGVYADVPGASGVWRELTEAVNYMSQFLTARTRNIAEVTAAVARGDFSRKITVEAHGEMLEMKNTINTMVDQLSLFAEEVTRVAREVGTEGRLGGQAHVPNVAGTWRHLTEAVNHLARSLTTQVRALGNVATAVAQGDLTRHVTVDAAGEVAELKDNINRMIANLRDTTRRTREQDWLKTNLAHVSSLMQGHHDLKSLASRTMSELTPLLSAQFGAFYVARSDPDLGVALERVGTYAAPPEASVDVPDVAFRLGEGLVGQAAVDQRTIVLEGASNHTRIATGLGTLIPSHSVFVPLLFKGDTVGVLEFASVTPFGEVELDLLERLKQIIGANVQTIETNTRTEALLAESQRLTQELRTRSEQLQRQQQELQRSNAELAQKAALLAKQNRDIQIRNFTISRTKAQARQASTLAKYKSEFLATMSHELRTPLNSMLILAGLLADNREGNLTRRQVEFAETIRSSGSELMHMIDDILDLAKMEAGRLEIYPIDVSIADLASYVETLFRPVADDRGLEFSVDVAPNVPATLYTDRRRLEQILRNLLSNAVKFTSEGSVRLRIRTAEPSEVSNPNLREARTRVAFSVEDTGIGVPADKLSAIFEAFRQSDGTTSRRYGGTGLGLSISKELTRLLGGEIQVDSTPDEGSTFSLILPAEGPDGSSTTTEKDESTTHDDDARDDLSVAIVDEQQPDVPPDRDEDAARDELDAPLTAYASDASQRQFHGEKVLVVDEDPQYRYAICAVLEEHQLAPICVDSGRAALQTLQREPDIGLVMMDVVMPDMDGYATMAEIRRQPRYDDLPILVVSARPMEEAAARSIDAGATEYVTKPVDIDWMLQLLATYLPVDPTPDQEEL
ncbi:ATP-binding protein [Thermasporomyces composti]|uniref:Circadian input-output histidine kinase CikA n=1 Tax=Thermasporomyces composti TaxID=696763 RepID=A0A3D9VBF9_THECX|nr:ATP-binding protein [Thermasporomyces composti]REF36355.1 GAF sensor hybrid histidine kinase [Thermasporomyces composti]